MPRPHRQHPVLGQQHRPLDQIRLPHRPPHHRHSHLPGPQRGERVTEVNLTERDVAARVPATEHLDHVPDLGSDHAHDTESYYPGHTPRRLGSPCHTPVNRVVTGTQVLAQLLTERGQHHRTTGALEQHPADPALLRLDRLTHPRLRHMQPLRAARATAPVGRVADGR